MTPRVPERSEGGEARRRGGGAPRHCKEDDSHDLVERSWHADIFVLKIAVPSLDAGQRLVGTWARARLVSTIRLKSRGCWTLLSERSPRPEARSRLGHDRLTHTTLSTCRARAMAARAAGAAGVPFALSVPRELPRGRPCLSVAFIRTADRVTPVAAHARVTSPPRVARRGHSFPHSGPASAGTPVPECRLEPGDPVRSRGATWAAT
jgi:hypothetical protein